MKAIGFMQHLPIDDPFALIDLEMPMPKAEGRDLLVAVKAISVNPIDVKIRSAQKPAEARPKILGWDAAGEVLAVGSEVQLFRVGDQVYYAGDLNREGANQEFHLVDERLVGHKPQSLSYAEAAAMPLSLITAWEGLFERLGIEKQALPAKNLLILGAAGGVGSITIQLAKWAGLKVIATASRRQSQEWVRSLGADEVLNHHQDLPSQLRTLNRTTVDYIANLSSTDLYWQVMAEMIAPHGKIFGLVENVAELDLSLFKKKSVGFFWQWIFTRPHYATFDLEQQGNILNEASTMFDRAWLKTTLNEHLQPINAHNLRIAHEKIESGRTLGKIVLSSW